MYDLKVINTRPLHCPRGGYGFFVLIPNNHRFLMILVFFLNYKGIKSYLSTLSHDSQCGVHAPPIAAGPTARLPQHWQRRSHSAGEAAASTLMQTPVHFQIVAGLLTAETALAATAGPTDDGEVPVTHDMPTESTAANPAAYRLRLRPGGMGDLQHSSDDGSEDGRADG
jgi:hypothetical protein